MIFEEYDSNKHRSIHYNLCWLDGKEDKIVVLKINRFNKLFLIHFILYRLYGYTKNYKFIKNSHQQK